MNTGYRVTALVGEEGPFDIDELHVALLDETTINKHPRNLRSVLGKIAWRLADSQPCGAWFDKGNSALVSTLPLKVDSIPYRVGNAQYEAKLRPVTRLTRPNLWDYLDRGALSTILGSVLRRAIDKQPGIDYRFERGAGVLTLQDASALAPHCPAWYDHTTAEELASLWKITDVPKLRDTTVPIFKPYRYIDFRTGVGLRGQPIVQYGFSTRMETSPEFTLSRILGLRENWTPIYNNGRFLFRVTLPNPGRETRVATDTGTWLVQSIDSRDMSDAMNDGRPALEDLKGWLSEYGVELNAQEEDRICEQRAVHVIRNVWDDDPDTLVVPARYLSPVVGFNNMDFYGDFVDGNLEASYANLIHIMTPTKVAMLEAIGGYLAENLKAELPTSRGTRTITLRAGGWTKEEEPAPPSRGTTPEERKARLAGEPRMFRLAEPHALLRRKGLVVPINLRMVELGEDEDVDPELRKHQNLMGYVYHPEFQVYRAAPQLARGLTLGIIAPNTKTSGERPVVADLLPAAFAFDAERIISKEAREKPRARGKVHPLKRLDRRLASFKQFFECAPMKSVFEGVTGNRGDPTAYLDAMDRANAAGAEAFLVVLPKGIPKHLEDRIYMATARYGFLEKKPVIHFLEGRWKKDTTFYATLYVALAKLNTRLGGLNFKIDLAKTVPLFQRYSRPLIVAYDFGKGRKDYLGVITATDASTQEMVVHKTPEISGVKEAIKELDHLLETLVRQYNPDLLVVLRDSKFISQELKGIALNFEKYGIDTLPIETLKDGGVSGYHLTRKGRGKGINVGTPYGCAFYTPEMHVNVFASSVDITQGVWSAIRYSVNPRPFPLTLDFDYEDVANLGFALAKMGGYFNDPSKTKYPDILARADKLIDLYQGGALSGVNREINAREFDPTK